MRIQGAVLGFSLLSLGTLASPQDGSILEKTPQRKALDHYRAGQDLMHGEHYEEAIQEFKEAIEYEPMMFFAFYAMGRAQMAMKHYADAVLTFRGCEHAYERLCAESVSGSADPGDALKEQIFELEANQFNITATGRGMGGQSQETLNQTRRIQSTIDDLKRIGEGLASTMAPPPAECMLSMGTSLVRLNRLPEAEDAFKAAIKGRPKFGEAHNNLAVLYRLEGRDRDALNEVMLAEKNKFKVRSEFKRALATPSDPGKADVPPIPPSGDSVEAASLHDDTPRLSYLQLAALFRTDPSGAILELAATTPAQIQFRLARLHTVEGRRETGELGLTMGGMLHTELAFQQFRTGLIELANENLRVARELMDLVTDKDLSERLVRPWFLAVAHEYQSRIGTETADRLLKRGLQRFPNDPQLLLAVAAIHEASLLRAADPPSELRDVEREYRHVLEADPVSVEAHLHLGHVLAVEGRLKEAEEPLLWARDHGHRPKELYLADLFLGGVAEGEGRLADAAADYRDALREDPEGQSAIIGLSHNLGLAGQESAGTQLIHDSLVGRTDRPRHLDPWWTYLVGLLTNGEETWNGLRALLAAS